MSKNHSFFQVQDALWENGHFKNVQKPVPNFKPGKIYKYILVSPMTYKRRKTTDEYIYLVKDSKTGLLREATEEEKVGKIPKKTVKNKSGGKKKKYKKRGGGNLVQATEEQKKQLKSEKKTYKRRINTDTYKPVLLVGDYFDTPALPPPAVEPAKAEPAVVAPKVTAVAHTMVEEEDIAEHKMEANLEKQLETVKILMPNAVPAKYVSVPKAPVKAQVKQAQTNEEPAEIKPAQAEEVVPTQAEEVEEVEAEEPEETAPNKPLSAPEYDLAKNTGKPVYDVASKNPDYALASNKPDYALAKNTGDDEIYTETTPIESAPIITAPISTAPISTAPIAIEPTPINLGQPEETSTDPQLVLQPTEDKNRKPEIIGTHLAAKAALFLQNANPGADVNAIQSGLTPNVQKNIEVNKKTQQIIEKEQKPTLKLQGGKKRKTYRKKKPKKNKTVTKSTFVKVRQNPRSVSKKTFEKGWAKKRKKSTAKH